MKLTVESTQLYKVCQAAAKAIPSKATMPIYSYLLIDADPFEGISVQSCNEADRSCYTLQSATVEGDAEPLCIQASQLLAILREIPAQPITIENEERTAHITWGGGSGKASLPMEDAALFPNTEFKELASAKIPVTTLRDIHRSVFFAVTEDELRPIMSTLMLDFSGEDRLVAVGTDGHRLVRYTITDDITMPSVEDNDLKKVAVPRRASAMLQTFIEETLRSDSEAMIDIAWSGNEVNFSSSKDGVTFRLTEGRYPNYNSVIPVNSPINAIVNRTALIGAVRRVSALASKEISLVKLTFTADSLTVKAENIDFSTSGEEVIPIQMTGTDRLMVGLKGTYMLDNLAHLDTEEICIEATSESRPVIFTGIDDERQLLMLLMPMQLNN